MRKDFIQYRSHEFAGFKLEKRGETWQLEGGHKDLTPLEVSVLVQLIEEKGFAVNVERRAKVTPGTSRTILANIRKALDASYVKADSRCEFIETIHGTGSRWIFDPSRGFSCLEIRPIEPSSADVKAAMLFLSSSLTSRIRKELNLSVYTGERPADSVPKSCFVVEGKCIGFDGTYRLILELSCVKLADGHHSFEVETTNLFKLIDDATKWALDSLKTLLPETIR